MSNAPGGSEGKEGRTDVRFWIRMAGAGDDELRRPNNRSVVRLALLLALSTEHDVGAVDTRRA